MIQKIKRTLENIAVITTLAIALSPFAMIGYEVISRFNPSYKTDKIEEAYFEKDNNTRRLYWRDSFIWDETGMNIIGHRNNNDEVSIRSPWGGKIEDKDLEVI